MTKFLLQVLCVVICFSVFSMTSALCNENQIDINTASLSELDKITGIGPVLAQRIIDSRSFNSVDDLIKVNGIGNITLDKIKQQNLACVSSEKETENYEDQVTQENENTTEPMSYKISEESSQINSNPSRGELINLSETQTKDIKTKKLEFNPGNLALYGLITFSLFLAILFLARKLKKQKTEFN